MRLPRVLLLIGITYILAFISHAAHLRKTVYGDGIFYYSWLRSIVIDRDIDFANEYAHEQVLQPKTKNGTYGNKYSIGPALFWAPGYIATHTIVRGDGWSLPYQIAVGMTSVLAAIAGIAMLTKHITLPQPVISLVLLLVAGATNLLFYGSIDAVNSHAISFFAAVVFLILLSQEKKHWFAIGLSLAFVASVRLQDMVYVIALIPFWRRVPWLLFIGGFILGFAPQLIVWQTLYGTLANPYLAGGETVDVFHPHVLDVLFSPQSGLFLWTPIVAVGVIGLMLPHLGRGKSFTQNRYVYLAIFCVQLYLVASWSTWWQGASVSGRMFVSVLPIIAIGLSRVIARIYTHRLLRSVLPLMAIGISMVNIMGIFYYLFTF